MRAVTLFAIVVVTVASDFAFRAVCKPVIIEIA
jgi:hypothetical protein